MSSAIKPALLWMNLPSDLPQRLRRCLDKASAESSPIDTGIIFFRADDVGVPGRNFTRLVELFQGHQVPLTMAVVPAWLTKPRWQGILELCGNRRDLWGWVQHGWRHQNYELRGKKQEFGPSRPLSQKRKDLKLGFNRLSVMMAENFLPVFIPPWNRCDQETLSVLPELGYEDMEISDGEMASQAWLKTWELDDVEEVDRTRKALLEYCKLDTLGMVKILEKLKEA